jgi:hypothetical protein
MASRKDGDWRTFPPRAVSGTVYVHDEDRQIDEKYTDRYDEARPLVIFLGINMFLPVMSVCRK